LLVLGPPTFVKISLDEYDQIEGAVTGLREVTAIEEKFDLVVGNYIDFENDLLTIATRLLITSDIKVTEMRRELNFTINRRSSNLLSSCRDYFDQVAGHLSDISRLRDCPELVAHFKSFASHEYDSRLAYRVMEALRNHIQHCGFPFSSIYDMQVVGDSEKTAISVTPFIRIADLERDKIVKRTIIDELKEAAGFSSRKDEVDAKPLIRTYVACLANVHEKVREVLKEYVAQWEATKGQAAQKFVKLYPNMRPDGLFAVKRHEGRLLNRVAIVRDVDDYRGDLERRNSDLIFLPNRYVTSESIS
jgi:hypothetical protein